MINMGESAWPGAAIYVVVVEYISILIIINVDLVEKRPAHFCPTVQLECLDFSETSFSHHKVMGRQIRLVVVARVFLWPAGLNLIFVLQNSTPGGVGARIPKIPSQIRVSRDQDFIIF